MTDDGANADSTAVAQLDDDSGCAGSSLTALKASEARFRAMSDASPLGIIATDVEGRCTYINAAYRTLSGQTSKQALGKHWVIAIHPDDLQCVLAELRDNARGTAPFQTEFRFLRSDGNAVWARVNVAALYDRPDTGVEMHGYVLTVEDISARKSVELALREAEAALFEENERAQVTLTPSATPCWRPISWAT